MEKMTRSLQTPPNVLLLLLTASQKGVNLLKADTECMFYKPFVSNVTHHLRNMLKYYPNLKGLENYV